MYFGYGQPQQVIPGAGSLSDVFHRHLLPHLSLEDLKNLSGVNHDWREAVWTAPAQVWREAAQRHLRSQHPLLSLPPARLKQGLYDYGRSHARLCSGQPQQTHLHQHSAEHILLAPDGTWMVLLSSGTLRCYALPSNELQHSAALRIDSPRAHAFHQGGSILALMSAGTTQNVFLLHHGTWQSRTVAVPMIRPQLEWHPVQPWLTSTFHTYLAGKRHPAVKMELGQQQVQAALPAEHRPVRLLWNAAGTRLAVFLRRNSGHAGHAGNVAGAQADVLQQVIQHPLPGGDGVHHVPQLQHMLQQFEEADPVPPPDEAQAYGAFARGRGRAAPAGDEHAAPGMPPPGAAQAGRGRGRGRGQAIPAQQVMVEDLDLESDSACRVAIVGDVHAMDVLTLLAQLPEGTTIQTAAWMQDGVHLALVLTTWGPCSAQLQLFSSHTGVAVRQLSAADAWLTSAIPEDSCQVHLAALPGDEQLVGWGRRGAALVDTWGGWLTCQLSRHLGSHCSHAAAISADGRHVALGWQRNWEHRPPESEAAAVVLSTISGQVEWELHKQTLGNLAMSSHALRVTPAWNGNDLVIAVQSDLRQRNDRLHHVICVRFSDA